MKYIFRFSKNNEIIIRNSASKKDFISVLFIILLMLVLTYPIFHEERRIFSNFSSIIFNYPLDISKIDVINNTGLVEEFVINDVNIKFINVPLQKLLSKNHLYILSSAARKDIRTSIRETWVSRLNTNVVFVTGYSRYPDEDLSSLFEESKLFKDMFIVNVTEEKYHHTKKLIAIFQHFLSTANQESLGESVLIVTEDDVFINPWNLESYLKIENHRKGIAAKIIENAQTVRQSRNKYFVSQHEYNYSVYPPYPSGKLIIVNGNLVHKIHKYFPYVKLMKIFDIYLGIILHKLNIQMKSLDEEIEISQLNSAENFTKIAIQDVNHPIVFEFFWNETILEYPKML